MAIYYVRSCKVDVKAQFEYVCEHCGETIEKISLQTIDHSTQSKKRINPTGFAEGAKKRAQIDIDQWKEQADKKDYRFLQSKKCPKCGKRHDWAYKPFGTGTIVGLVFGILYLLYILAQLIDFIQMGRYVDEGNMFYLITSGDASFIILMLVLFLLFGVAPFINYFTKLKRKKNYKGNDHIKVTFLSPVVYDVK